MAAPELDVAYVARLARLDLTEAETRQFQSQLAQILEFVDVLKQVDVEGVEPTAHPGDVADVVRADEARAGLSPVAALANAPRRANDLFIVTRVVE